MWIKKLALILLIAALLCPAACAEVPDTPESEPVIPVATGADSVKTLLEITSEYIQSDGDYSVIADVHDQQACMAYFLIIILYDRDYSSETVTDITWDQAMEKANLIFGDANTLIEKDPELAEILKNKMGVLDRDEVVNNYISGLREALRNKEIAEEDPSYEMLTNMLIDWDKGTDYIFDHYEEFLRNEIGGHFYFSLDEAMESLRDFLQIDYSQDMEYFKDFTIVYRPENSDIGRNGTLFRYDVGSVKDEYGYSLNLDMIYYVKDGVYYLIDYNFAVI